MKKIILVAAVTVTAFAVVVAEDLVPLKTDLPTPMFVGTPKTIKTDNLEQVQPGKMRPPVMVPKDVQNVAIDCAVTASDMEPVIGELDLVTDGDKEGADGSYVELGPMKQWVQIDLGEPYDIFGIVLWHFHSEARVYKDVIVQVADNTAFDKNVRTVFNNDHDNSLGMGTGKDKEWIETYQGKSIPVKGEKAQYVRLYSNGSTSSEMNHYIEVEVYGR